MHLTVRDVARFLRTTEFRVYQWIDSGGIPVERVDDQFRFNPTDLLEWATLRKIPVSVEMFADADQSAPKLADAIQRGGVHRVEARDAQALLRKIADLLPAPASVDREFLFQMLRAREASGSTAVGDGIAIPHVRNPIALHRQPASVTLAWCEAPIEFGAPDGQPAHTFFVLATPTIRSHLQLLAKLALALHRPSFRAAVLERRTLGEIVREAELCETSAKQGPPS